jgi:hypothetical protein
MKDQSPDEKSQAYSDSNPKPPTPRPQEGPQEPGRGGEREPGEREKGERTHAGEGAPRPPERTPKLQGRAPTKDITPILRDWTYEPGEINVRKISGADGAPKLQMRLNLGVLQMEMTGRPDGDRPHGHESLLDYFEQELTNHQKDHAGDAEGFHLSGDQCRSLREEAEMYYHRYLSLLVLEDFSGVVRDTARNLRVLDLCGKYATDEQDRLWLEQYRPYIVMMNARAQASIEMRAKHYGQALKTVDSAIKTIRSFYVRFGQEQAFSHSNEVRMLKRLSRQIQSKLPVDPLQRLRRRLERAVKEERYEDAAKLRDALEAKQAEVSSKIDIVDGIADAGESADAGE